MTPPTPMLDIFVGLTLTDVAAGFGSLVVIATALGYFAKKLRHVARLLEALSKVIGRELNPNHGSSMKDDLYGITMSLDKAHSRIDHLEQTLGVLAESQHHIWPAIEAVANARPPWPEDDRKATDERQP